MFGMGGFTVVPNAPRIGKASKFFKRLCPEAGVILKLNNCHIEFTLGLIYDGPLALTICHQHSCRKKKSASRSQQSTSGAPSAPATLSTVGETESRCSIYEDQDDAGRGTRKKGVQYVYYNNASYEATVIAANGQRAARGGKTNGKTSSKRRTSGSDDSIESPVAPSGGPLSWNDLCDLYAKEENDKNERTMRRASSNRAEVDCEQPDLPVYAKVNKERKRK